MECGTRAKALGVLCVDLQKALCARGFAETAPAPLAGALLPATLAVAFPNPNHRSSTDLHRHPSRVPSHSNIIRSTPHDAPTIFDYLCDKDFN